MKKGFTLIELLIVVAIIGILAAIAVPNFLNAQIRAKISRSYADMKAISTAINSLRLDKNQLPIDPWDDDTTEGREILKTVFNNVGNVPGDDRGARDCLAVLTSPISYLSSIPNDPFFRIKDDINFRGFGSPLDTYLYTNENPSIPGDDQGVQALLPDLAPLFHNPVIKVGEFALIGVGPDGLLGIISGTLANRTITPTRGFPYSSSNGLVSLGDIVMTSGGIVGQN